jgi:hypothetical protein
MALQVGELRAMLTVDTDAYDSGLHDAERAFRQSGDRMERDAERSGTAAGEALGQSMVDGVESPLQLLRMRLARSVARATAAAADELDGLSRAAAREGVQAGEALGEGMIDGTETGLRDLRTAAAREGEQAGEALGDGLTAEAEQGADQAVDATAQRMEQLKLAAMGIGVAAGAALMMGFTKAMDKGKLTAQLSAQLALTPAEAKRYGKVAGQLYSEGIVDDFQAATATMRAAANAGLIPTGATEKQLKNLSTRVADLAAVLNVDVADAANAAGQMVRNGLAKNGTQAMDMLFKATERNANRFGDLSDTVIDSADNLAHFGLTGEQALGVIIQGLDKGAPSAEVFAGALEEMTANAADGAETFDKLGFNGMKMAADLAGGGPKAAEALDQLMDKLREMKDPTERSKVMVELFGEEAVALQNSLLAVDPSEATKKLGDFGGAADDAAERLRDNATTALTTFNRAMESEIVEFLGDKVIPKLNELVQWAKDNPKEFETASVIIVGAFAAIGAAAVAAGISMAGAWIAGMGPIGWVIALILLVVATIYYYRDEITAVMRIASGAVVEHVDEILSVFDPSGLLIQLAGWVAGVDTTGQRVGRSLSGLKGWLAGWVTEFIGQLNPLSPRMRQKMLEAIGAMQRGAMTAAVSLMGWIRGLPGRAVAALGSIGSRLYASGRALIGGFISGILSRIGEVARAASRAVSAAREYFPFSPAKKGPFSGRGYTSYSGAALIQGFEDGITGRLPHLAATLARLPSAPSFEVAPAGAGWHDRTPSAGAGSGSATGWQTVRIVLDGPEQMRRLVRTIVADGGGDVQKVLGRQ